MRKRASSNQYACVMKIDTQQQILHSKTWEIRLPTGTRVLEMFSTDKKGKPIPGTSEIVGILNP